MDLLQIIGIVVAVWIALSALIVAVTVAAGRADRRDRRFGGIGAKAARAALPGQQRSRFRTRRAAPVAQRSAPDQRAQAAMRAAIR
ncbi:hypothetical protein [Conexibacter sp. CPCC 206217]|uniref:hypothetical protein n=1 Tax=Conexibacter sp. CPCC 206217 TaxID=3064574 RepID=UPI00271D5445|nr:hypothetical protein [Conexibacter sp. CPCC 206217]MDO8209432.1 hypothetical protein [Conexibacter sp. CPCC 206217]